jgi:pyruvate dehydrogenase E2 component (dihydrolipoamide acetyltransferase)
MRREIEMPRLSEAVEEGVLVTWLVEPGATVREGDLIAEVQVEKTSSEVRAPVAGRLDDLLFVAGDVVRQGDPIAFLVTLEPSGTAAPVDGREASAGDAGAGPAAPPAAAREIVASPSAREIVASPSAKRLARELGVDLRSIAGSGPGGRIVEADVATAVATPAGAGEPGPGAAVEPLSAMRRTIAERLRSGLATTAQLTLTAEADVTELAERLAGWSSGAGRRITYTEAIVRACALALRDHPRVAATWSERGIVRAKRIDIGVAVALDEGLIVPVVRDADYKDLPALGREIADLAERARSGTLVPADTDGACFSVTNLGAYRIDAFTPLLNPPQTAILGVGRARPRPAVVDGGIVPRTLVVLSLTFDHQVVDGAPAAAFLATVVSFLEQPQHLGPPGSGGMPSVGREPGAA